MNAGNCTSIAEYLQLDFDDKTVRIQNSCPVAVLKGSWKHMGRQYAAQAHRPIRYHIASQLGMALAMYKSYEAAYAVLPEYEAMLQEVFPEYLQFVRGMQEGLAEAGFDIAYEDVLIGYISLAKPDPQEACAAGTVWQKDGEGKVSQVWAGIHSDSPYVSNYAHPAVLAYPDGAHAFISFTGFTNGYLNDAGLVCMSTAGSAAGPGDIRKGLPICISLLYNAAFSVNAEQAAARSVEKLRVGSGEICHFSDAQGGAVILETTAAHYALRRSGDFEEGNFLIQSNSYLTAEMQSSGGQDPRNVYRYDSIFRYLKERGEILDLDVLREALSNTSYYDKERDAWICEWKRATGVWSPERKDTVRGPAMRRMFEPASLTAWILMGAEDPLISKLPQATGAYGRIRLLDSPARTAAEALEQARICLWYAARDMDLARDIRERGLMPGQLGGRELPQARMAHLDAAREEIYRAVNWQTLAGAAACEQEQLALLGKSITASLAAQCHAKAAQSGDPARLLREE